MRLLFLLGMLVFVLGWMGCGCGSNPTQPPPTRTTLPKIECRTHGDCPPPKQCLYDICTTVPVLPTIRLVVPSQPENQTSIQLQVLGHLFEQKAVVYWDQTALPTTFVSSGELLATLSSGTTDTKTHEIKVVHLDGRSSRAYLLSLRKDIVMERISFSQIPVGCGKETLVVWGQSFWKQTQASIISADGKKEYVAESIEIRPNGELHITFDFSKMTKGSYELVLHQGDKAQGVKHPILLVDSMPDPVVVSTGPRQFWWGTQAHLFLVGVHLEHTDVRFQQQPVRLVPINRSTYSVSLDLLELPRQQETSHFWLTLRKRCQTQQSFYPVEVYDIGKPTISRTNPSTVTYATQEDVIVIGDGFHPDATLWINGEEVIQSKRLSLKQFRIPRSFFSKPGSMQVQIRNPQYLHSNLWTMVVDYTPKIKNIFPAILRKKRDQTITIEGNNFGPDVRVRVGDSPIEGVERINETRLLLSSQNFLTAQSYTIVVVNPGETALSSPPYSFQVKEGPQIDTLSSPLVLLEVGEGDIQIRGSDFDEKGQLLVDGKPVDENYSAWVSDVAWNLAVRFFTQEGEYTLQIRNVDQTLSNPVTLWVRKVEKKRLSEIKEIGELTYLCGEGLRKDELPVRPRISFSRRGETQPLIEVESSNSTFDTTCLYFNTREIAPLEPQIYLVRVCQDDGKETVCSNEYPWEWRGLSQKIVPKEYPPQIHWIRPLQPTSFIWSTENAPKTLSFMMGGQYLRGNTQIFINGVELKTEGKTRLSILDDRIIFYDVPTPSPIHGDHVIQVKTQHGLSNTFFFHTAKEAFLRILWTPQLFLPRDDSFNFKWYGYNLTTALWLLMDDVQVKAGTTALPWSQFASTPPHFLSSFDWAESSKVKVGLRKFQLKDSKTNVTSNALWMPAGNDELWGEEPLTLQAVEDIYRYTNSAGSAPYVGQSSALRLAYTGFQSSSTDPKTRGVVLVDQQAKTYVSGITTLFGYSYVDVAAVTFSGSPRVVPIVLKHPNGTQSNHQFLTVMPASSYRLTKIYNASDFSSIVRPDKSIQLQIHGNFLSKEDEFFFLGKKVSVDHYYKDADSRDEFVRITLDAGDLPDGQYPLWAVNPRKQISNTLLVSVRVQGIGGAPRLRSVNPMYLSKTALQRVNHKARLVIQAIGLTPQTVMVSDQKTYSLQWIEEELVYVDIDISSLSPGEHTFFLQEPSSASKSTPFVVVVD